MGHTRFVERHGDGWRFRVRLPAKLASLSSRRELRVRLRSIPRSVAVSRARCMRVEAERLFGVLGRMTDVNEAGAAIDAWLSSQLARYATKLVSEGRLFLDPGEMSGSEAGAASAAEFELDLSMRSAHSLDPHRRQRCVQRALSGDPVAKRELQPIIDAGLRAASSRPTPCPQQSDL